MHGSNWVEVVQHSCKWARPGAAHIPANTRQPASTHVKVHSSIVDEVLQHIHTPAFSCSHTWPLIHTRRQIHMPRGGARFHRGQGAAALTPHPYPARLLIHTPAYTHAPRWCTTPSWTRCCSTTARAASSARSSHPTCTGVCGAAGDRAAPRVLHVQRGQARARARGKAGHVGLLGREANSGR